MNTLNENLLEFKEKDCLIIIYNSTENQ